MKTLRVSHPDGHIETTISLPASKSISNRALIIQAIQPDIKLHNLSKADDTLLMQAALHSSEKEVFLKNAGTCVRFLTAYFAATPGEKIITGDSRMQHRPLHTLIEALQKMGADITAIEQPGHIPISIHGKHLAGNNIQVDATESSQFTSALLLIAPLLSSGLTMHVSPHPVSVPYIQMTLSLLNYFGIKSSWDNDTITIPPGQQYQPAELTIEPDWSAASYWYEIAALSKTCDIFLKNLSENSWQGDKAIAPMMETYFGVKSIFGQDGVRLIKTNTPSQQRHNPLNLIHTPDLTPAIAATAAGCHLGITLEGLQTLALKETDRLSALTTELKKAGYDVNQNGYQLLIKTRRENAISMPANFYSYSDHRMAMALAPLALKLGTVTISQPEVVDKSYPDFWNHLQQAGFVLSE